MELKNINAELIEEVFTQCFNEQQTLITEILKYNSKMVTILSEEERAFPGNSEYYESGYYKTMLKRYFFAGKYLADKKNILDTCCGLGWGSYIISKYASSVTAFDNNPEVIEFCNKTWNSINVNWVIGNALDLSFLGGKKYDLVLGMETIEHFTKENGIIYLSNVASVLNDQGIFIGTSYFPKKRKDANELCALNPYHKHIFTYKEISKIFKKKFKNFEIIDNWMIVATK
jgi:2-polyprenyl-3-methyl-5-hydroxy-6-metoxy-1,4-benzoquinol methylase